MHCEWHSVGPIDLEDLVRELACRQHVGWGTRGLRAFKANVDEGEQDSVFVGGGIAALVKELQHFFGESNGAALLVAGHRRSQYAARAGMIQRIPPRASGTSPR